MLRLQIEGIIRDEHLFMLESPRSGLHANHVHRFDALDSRSEQATIAFIPDSVVNFGSITSWFSCYAVRVGPDVDGTINTYVV